MGIKELGNDVYFFFKNIEFYIFKIEKVRRKLT
jgi:hypothetical protein